MFSRSPKLNMRFSSMILLASLLAASQVQGQIVTPEVKKVAEAYMCECGDCNYQLSQCSMLNCPSATPLRAEIADYLKKGLNEQQIKETFIAKYGKVILSAPTAQGFDRAAWALPFVMLLAGLAFVYVVIRSWVHRKPAPPAAPGGAAAIPENFQKKLDQELRDFE